MAHRCSTPSWTRNLYGFDVGDEPVLRWQPTLLPLPYPAADLAAVPGVAGGCVKPPR